MNRSLSLFRTLRQINWPRVIMLVLITSEMLCLTFVSSGCDETEGYDCTSIYSRVELSECSEGDGGAGGLSTTDEDLPVLPMPLPDGYVSQCTQGPDGSHSHRFTSTKFGVDLDTSNYEGEGVYAPVSGIVYVHGSPNSASGFGYHLNVSVGGGLYVVIAHLKEIVVATGDEVVVGQFLGIEGCTGNCTGDHVHLGLSEGNPAEGAEDGISVPFALRARDVTEGDSASDIPAEDLVCALSGGHRYESRLEVSNWHADGTILSVPGEDDIYVVDQGRLHAWEDEHVMFDYGFWYEDVVAMSPRERDCWAMGNPITEGTCYRAVKEGQGFWLAYECENNPGRYRLPIPGNAVSAVMTSWGIQSAVDSTTELGTILMSYPEGMGNARLRDGALVRESSASSVYAVNEGAALPVQSWDVFIAMGLLNQSVLTVPDGALEDAVLGVAVCPGNNCIDWDRIRSCGTVIDVSDVTDGGAGGSDDDPPRPDDDDTEDDLPDGPSDDDDVADPADDDDDGSECEADTDGDGTPDCEDNCPLADNDQGDIDLDGTGDSCDPDIDGDGVGNALDCAPFNPAIGLCDDPETPEEEPETPEDDNPEGGDDDDASDDLPDDDDAADDDDATVDPPEVPPTEDDPPVTTSGVLVLEYTPPTLLAPYTYIELSGEYTLADGSLGFPWVTGLLTVVNSSSLYFLLPGVSSGDSFRFSLEYYDAPMSVLSWGCIGSAPYSAQGTLQAEVDGTPIPVNLVDNFLGGCEDFLTIP